LLRRRVLDDSAGWLLPVTAGSDVHPGGCSNDCSGRGACDTTGTLTCGDGWSRAARRSTARRPFDGEANLRTLCEMAASSCDAPSQILQKMLRGLIAIGVALTRFDGGFDFD
jgi:hypothetical protein